MTREERPYCYGKLECVFPMGENGLRETPESCMVCYCKTECLRTAMQGQAGDQVREEKVDRAYAAGVMGFFERWSRKKALQRPRRAKAPAIKKS
ncbi:MAG: hypothetical protein PVG19_09525 [Desulfobacterales bacterium]|jgi:hypothetical protein